MVHIDGKFKSLDEVDHDYQVGTGSLEICQHWPPWCHNFVSNATAWINGTHHGVSERHSERYLGVTPLFAPHHTQSVPKPSRFKS